MKSIAHQENSFPLECSSECKSAFIDYGVAMPVSHPWHMVATTDRKGRAVALAWLSDHRGGYAIIMVDAETGESREFAIPFRRPASNGSPFACYFSS